MSSSQPFASSPLSGRVGRKKSKFTFRHLSQLAVSATSCPLRVIAHIDLDAFYAQCEMVRLGTPADQPLAVQQWQGLIAINYPARKYGLNRHVTITEAQKACPEIIVQHVATWREGDEKWAYHEDAPKHIATHKVSLDPYRMESRKILALIKETLPAPPLQKVEKASVDEVFLDVSSQVHGLLLERYPELNRPPPYDDPTEKLPAPPSTALDWNADALVDLDEGEAEEDDPDWDDIAMLLGSEIVRGVRTTILEKLKYTCSAGIAKNKMLAKLGSGHKKPNQQTIVRNRAIQQFLSGFKISKIRNLGGKLGDEVVAMFNVETVTELLEVPVEQLKKLGEDTGMWLFNTIRGEDHSDVSSRTQIKSMLSAKSFRPSINSFEQGTRWLRIFVADIFGRLVEEGVLDNKRRPKTINLHHRQGGQTKSKQTPIPMGRPINEDMLFDLAKNLLAQIVVDGRAWPCANLSLSVGGFEDAVTGNRGIGGFLLRGDEAKNLLPQPTRSHSNDSSDLSEARPAKKPKLDGGSINKFFSRDQGRDDRQQVNFDQIPSGQTETVSDDFPEIVRHSSSEAAPSDPDDIEGHIEDDEHGEKSPTPIHQTTIEKYFCSDCQKHILLDQKAEHEDWHFAKSLQNEERAHVPGNGSANQTVPKQTLKPVKRPKGRGRPAANTTSKAEKGQSRLAFGR